MNLLGKDDVSERAIRGARPAPISLHVYDRRPSPQRGPFLPGPGPQHVSTMPIVGTLGPTSKAHGTTHPAVCSTAPEEVSRRAAGDSYRQEALSQLDHAAVLARQGRRAPRPLGCPSRRPGPPLDAIAVVSAAGRVGAIRP